MTGPVRLHSGPRPAVLRRDLPTPVGIFVAGTELTALGSTAGGDLRLVCLDGGLHAGRWCHSQLVPAAAFYA